MEMKKAHRKSGFTLVEMVIVIVISGILITVVLKSLSSIHTTGKTEDTKQEMESLAMAITGNPSVSNNGTRTDFGYVGDVGALPANLDALYQNPGGYSTWRGPYVANRYAQMTDDYKRDAWGNLYTYSGGLTITSNGGGTIIRQLAPIASDLLYNSVTGAICDIDGTPPGLIYKDSLTVVLTYPNGTGGLRTRTGVVDAAGYFSFDSIPIGNQDLKVVYKPQNDTIPRLVSVTPHSSVTAACRFNQDLWFNAPTTGGSLTFLTGSDTTSGSNCENLSFWITNTGGTSATITSITVSWTGITAYYKTIIWGSTTVFDLGGSPRGVSGTTYTLSTSQTLSAGATVKISVNDFRQSNTTGGENKRDMQEKPITITFSNGSVLTFETREICN
jgi:prepilin-type N-terminal cleavage/methylation domain-containing protein